MARTAKSKVQFKLVNVTVAMAKAWLEKNKSNRKVSKPLVAKWLRAMVADQWRGDDSPEGISIGVDGALLDGQHRLLALVEYGKPVRMLVIYNVSEEARKVMNSGRSRSVADTLKLHYGVEYPRPVVAAASRLRKYETGERLSLSADEVLEIYRRHRIGFQWWNAQTKTIRLGGAYMSGPLVFLHKKNKKDVELFYDKLQSMAGLARNSPVHRIRDYLLMRDKGGYSGAAEAALMVFTAFGHFQDKHTLSKLQLAPETFSYYRKQAGLPAKADRWAFAVAKTKRKVARSRKSA